MNAAHDEFKQVGLTSPKKLKPVGQSGTSAQGTLELEMELTDEVAEILELERPKAITIEGEPEAVQEKKNLPDVRFTPTDEQQVKSLREIFQTLERLTDFTEAKYGNT
ncbi:MAG TPA: hypothetical protein VH280_23965 [Verrucomicrobiae bacterium]|nr:hypothetical protein [Verrucomicrobiae bacterium]